MGIDKDWGNVEVGWVDGGTRQEGEMCSEFFPHNCGPRKTASDMLLFIGKAPQESYN